MDLKQINRYMKYMEHWQHILFKDGSNPYIIYNKTEFCRIAKKYKLTKVAPDTWIAE